MKLEPNRARRADPKRSATKWQTENWKLGALLAGVFTVTWASAATLSGTTDLGTGADIPLVEGGQTVSVNGSGIYDFGDMDGDGSRVDAVAPAGLAMGGANLTTANGTDITLNLNGGGLTATTGEIKTARGGDCGDVTITNAANIAIWDIDTYCSSTSQTGPPSSGDVTVRHEGSFSANDIYAATVRRSSGSLFFDGDEGENGASGSFSANLLDIHNKSLSDVFHGTRGKVAVSNYTSVTIGSVLTYRLCSGTGDGGLLVTGIVDTITITGTVDLRHNKPANNGRLRLYAGGAITMTDLVLTNVLSATLVSAVGKAYVTERLIGFPTGTPANGTLDCPTGQYVYYKPSLPENAYLGGQNYTLKSGGILRVAPSGTIVTFK